jgi:quinol monooxygenase YgiN
MFARVLSLQIRLEKRKELVEKVLAQIIPIIKRSEGALQILVLQNDNELDKIQILSIWRSREDMDSYHQRHYSRVKALLQPYVTFSPFVTFYRVDESVTSLLSAAISDIPRNSDPAVSHPESASALPSPADETAPHPHRVEAAAGAVDSRTTP